MGCVGGAPAVLTQIGLQCSKSNMRDIHSGAAAVIIPYPSTYVRSPYNAYESVSSTSCSVSTPGCCSGTSLTRLVEDTSVTYNCYVTNDPGGNDMSISVFPCIIACRFEESSCRTCAQQGAGQFWCAAPCCRIPIPNVTFIVVSNGRRA